MKEEYRSITLEWLNKAENDLDYARASFREFESFFSQMCILCHDAAEKYLKACLATQGLRPNGPTGDPSERMHSTCGKYRGLARNRTTLQDIKPLLHSP